MADTERSESNHPGRLGRGLRSILSVVLLFHLGAVFLPPFTFATRSGTGAISPFADSLTGLFAWYVDLLYLDHGYFFFAPNPGPSHLLRARVEFGDGRPARELTFPDRTQHWPRLFYHRHFMLAEQLHADFMPSEAPPEVVADPAQLAQWQLAHQRYRRRKESFEDHLRHVYGAQHVTLTRIEHSLITPGEFAAGTRKINAPDTYRELSDQPEALPPLPFGGGR